jgi:hypothetical protein
LKSEEANTVYFGELDRISDPNSGVKLQLLVTDPTQSQGDVVSWYQYGDSGKLARYSRLSDGLSMVSLYAMEWNKHGEVGPCTKAIRLSPWLLVTVMGDYAVASRLPASLNRGSLFPAREPKLNRYRTRYSLLTPYSTDPVTWAKLGKRRSRPFAKHFQRKDRYPGRERGQMPRLKQETACREALR